MLLSKVAELQCPPFRPAGVGIVLLFHGYVLYISSAQWSLGSQHGIPSVSGLQYLRASHLWFASAQSQSMRTAMPATSICQRESIEYHLSEKVNVFDFRKGIMPWELVKTYVRMNELVHEIVEKQTKSKTVSSLHCRLQKLKSQRLINS